MTTARNGTRHTGPGPVRLADVATHAGVSPATVSRVLNGNYPVAETTRHRVLRSVQDLGYVTHGPAAALAASSSDLLGVLVNDIADPFFGLLAGAVQQETGTGPDRKLAVVCNTAGAPERELEYLTLLHRQRATAVVLTGGTTEADTLRTALATHLHRLAATGTRIVQCGRPPLPPEHDDDDRPGNNARTGTDHHHRSHPGTGHDGTSHDRTGHDGTGILTVDFAHRNGARRLTEHLTDLGHRRIGCLTGPPGRTTTTQRLAGHRDALTARHPGPDPAADPGRLTVHAAYDRTSGYHGTLELLRRDPHLTAVIAPNDTAALGACAALRDQGLRIPHDVSVAGFDDLPCSADAWPPLTTVRLPLTEAGTLAGRLALGRSPTPPGATVTLPTRLIVRASTAPPPPAHDR